MLAKKKIYFLSGGGYNGTDKKIGQLLGEPVRAEIRE
jgi:hypothetical protein